MGITSWGTCKKCGTALGPNNVAYWEDIQLCRGCMGPSKANRDEAIADLVCNGYIVIHRIGSWRIRLEVRSASEEVILALLRHFRGSRHRHNEHTWKWQSSALNNIRAIAAMLAPYTPKLATALTIYCNRSGDDRSDYAAAMSLAVGRRNIAIRNYADPDAITVGEVRAVNRQRG